LTGVILIKLLAYICKTLVTLAKWH